MTNLSRSLVALAASTFLFGCSTEQAPADAEPAEPEVRIMSMAFLLQVFLHEQQASIVMPLLFPSANSIFSLKEKAPSREFSFL